MELRRYARVKNCDGFPGVLCCRLIFTRTFRTAAQWRLIVLHKGRKRLEVRQIVLDEELSNEGSDVTLLFSTRMCWTIKSG